MLHSITLETNMLYIHCFRLFSIMNAKHLKQTIYSRPVLYTLLHGGSTPPTSTNQERPAYFLHKPVKSPLNTGITEKVQGFDIYNLSRQRNPLGKCIRRVLFSFLMFYIL